MGRSPPVPGPFDMHGEVTLLDLVLFVQELARDDEETVRMVSTLLRSGRVRLRSAPAAERTACARLRSS